MTDYNTQPTIQTVLEEMRAGFAAINTRLDAIEKRMRRQNELVDNFIEEVIEMRRDLKELSR